MTFKYIFNTNSTKFHHHSTYSTCFSEYYSSKVKKWFHIIEMGYFMIFPKVYFHLAVKYLFSNHSNSQELLLKIYYKVNKVHYTSEICIETPQNTAKMYIKRVYFFGWRPRIWWSPPCKHDLHAIFKMVQHLWSTFNFDTFLVFSQGDLKIFR